MSEPKITSPIIIQLLDGLPVAVGPADRIRPALHGAAPLPVEHGTCTGDTVWLKGRSVWRDDAATIEAVARTVQHPVHGEVLAAWVDYGRLDQAPVLASKKRETTGAAMAAYARAEASLPSCDNCGDCPKCC